MQEVRAHMLSMSSCTEYYLVDREVTKRESRYTAMMNVRHNKRGVKIHETEWGEPQDCVVIAKWSGRDVIILHTETDRCTIIPYTANAIETKSVAKLLALDWAREPSRGKHGIYLIHDGIHYNAIRLRDNQEEDEQNKESNCTECTNKKQQRRTKEPAALATPNMQDNSSEEDIHEEGDKMQATQDNLPSKNIHGEGDKIRTAQDNAQENIHEEKEERRATNAPCGRVCGSRTQDNTQQVEKHEEKDKTRNTNAPYGRGCGSHTKDKTNEKGKRKSEKHEALCEAEHRKTKKNKQTKQQDQQKRKRHRETDTLRADAGKK